MTYKDLPVYKSNPFLPELVSKINVYQKAKTKTEDAAIVSTGEVVAHKVASDEMGFKWYDQVPFIKVFNDLDNYRQMANLSKAANYLFWLIASNVRPNTDCICISLVEYLEFSETQNKAQYYVAICELAEKFVIAKMGKDVYYININKFFNGDRTKLLGAESAQDVFILRKKG